MILVSTLTLAPSGVHAKRSAPAAVPPLRIDGTEYSVPHGFLMGVVLATDLKSGIALWRRQVYSVIVDPDVEEDIQACYITKIAQGKGCLVIENEHGFRYVLDLHSLQVRTLKGASVIRWRMK
ncbi:hypothetical protein [Mesoterricola sediminis]|uniref:hypothetical protein n=1 Tax=Mesoterricola sediminis TaxID=2927980 RepID=UPI0029301EB6|nr:hypothetical protein [Mesoterricola sediminis]